MLCVLVNIRFQVLFHSPPGVLFTFPSQYCSTIGHWVVFRLGGWAPHLPIGFHVSDGTLDTVACFCVSLTWLSHSLADLPKSFSYAYPIAFTVLTPNVLLPSVWPLSLSLATTRKISVDFSSSGYLDVSVPRVPLLWLCIHHNIIYSSYMWFPNSEICGSKLICSSPQLIAACHVLRRLPMPRHSPYALYSLNFPFGSLYKSLSFFHELFEFANNCCFLGLNCNKNTFYLNSHLCHLCTFVLRLTKS